jgi:OFA family oxalate/formate antiporter-like MFS transporter
VQNWTNNIKTIDELYLNMTFKDLNHLKPNFLMIFLGIGVLGGIATGCGYWVSLTLSVRWFPEKKGLITGIVSAGFGFGAVLLVEFSETILTMGRNVLYLFKVVGLVYGLIICIASNFYFTSSDGTSVKNNFSETLLSLQTTGFKKLFAGIFFGSFAGLLVIGSLNSIGVQSKISHDILAIGIAVFALANFCGRLLWGYFSDYFNGSLSIFLALLIQSLAILSLNIFHLTSVSFLTITALIGFGFGGNFVLFAKETVQIYGVEKLGVVYPFVFAGYAIAGIAGPLSGGLLYDSSGSFYYAILLASLMSLVGSILFFVGTIATKKK